MNDETRATWDAAYINNLPDSAFLYIEPGGQKDDEGKTTPRSLRHFPVKDAQGNVDMPHLRNAMSRIPQSNLSDAVKAKCTQKAQDMMDSMDSGMSGGRAIPEGEFEVRGTDLWPDADFALRMPGDGRTLEGYAAIFDKPSMPIPGGPRGAFTEIIRQGAFTRTLSRQPDVVLRYQHNLTTLPLARTKSGTLSLTETDQGLFARAELPDTTDGNDVRELIKRGDISGMSFRFRIPSRAGEKWSSEFRTRELLEVQLGSEISVVDFPAYPDTSVAVRHLAEAADIPVNVLTEAFDILNNPDPDVRLTPEQAEHVYAAIRPKVEQPHISPKVVAMRERLASRMAS